MLLDSMIFTRVSLNLILVVDVPLAPPAVTPNEGAIIVAVEKSAEEIVKEEVEKSQTPVPKELNAFCILYFCLEDPYHNHTLEFISHAFAHYPDREYCVVTAPTSSVEIAQLPVIQPSLGSGQSHCLYVVNKFSVSQVSTVRYFNSMADLSIIQELISGIPNEISIMEKISQSNGQIPSNDNELSPGIINLI